MLGKKNPKQPTLNLLLTAWLQFWLILCKLLKIFISIIVDAALNFSSKPHDLSLIFFPVFFIIQSFLLLPLSVITISNFSHMINTVFLRLLPPLLFLRKKKNGLSFSGTEIQSFLSRSHYLYRYKRNIQNIPAHITEVTITTHHVSRQMTVSFFLPKHIIACKFSHPFCLWLFLFQRSVAFLTLKEAHYLK